jgi:hypothetical protein
MPRPSKLLLGDIYKKDPFAVVAINGLSPPLLIEVPGADQMADPDFCGQVYNVVRFVGRSPYTDASAGGYLEPFLRALHRNSTVILLP